MSGFHPSLRAALLALMTLFSAAQLSAQAIDEATFKSNFSQGLRLQDEKLMDKWMKRQYASDHAWKYFEELYAESMGGNVDNSEKTDALKASWERCFEGKNTLHRVERWLDSVDKGTFDSIRKVRGEADKLWRLLNNMEEPKREELLTVVGQFRQLGESARATGHQLWAAQMFGWAAVVGGKIKPKDRNLESRHAVADATEEYLAARRAWSFDFDAYYMSSNQFLEHEKARLEEAEKAADKRRDEGYGDNSKGVDGLVMPNVAAKRFELKYAALKDWESQLGYGSKAGAFPPLWQSAYCKENGTSNKLSWFQGADIYFGRVGGNKFVISLDPDDLDNGMPIHVSNKPKPSEFFLDAGKELPYTMFFWVGSDRQQVGLAECNLAPRKDYVLSYFKSGASWKTMVEQEPVVFYDDNCNGRFGEANPFEAGYKTYTAGEWDGEGDVAPHLDSMKVGKGKRVPASEFVKLAAGWVHLQCKGTVAEYRPLNPEYFKTGKVKLVWKGPKKSRPQQVVIQGRGDYQTAVYDLASAKELEVPAGEYNVIFGRIALGKGARVQNATMYPGDSETFNVEPGKTKELVMGAPFKLTFTRRGDKNASIDALKVFVKESSGCIFTELQGMTLAPEVVYSKSDTGKGAKVVGKFLPFTDGELVNTAGRAHQNLATLCALFPLPQGYKEGPLKLDVKLPGTGLKLGLRQKKKHPIFGKLETDWK
ncbi:MAG: hypothetical protein NXI31_03520 [bacterium]|nr:hypothetical protein [bacterium]